jgi:cell division protein FtsL
MDLALNEIHFLGNSLCHWGIILVIGGYILKMYRKGLSKKTKLLVLIPCALYVLLFVLTLIFPVTRMGSISLSNGENIFVALMIIVSIGFWGALLSGLYRMYREATVLDKLDK